MQAKLYTNSKGDQVNKEQCPHCGRQKKKAVEDKCWDLESNKEKVPKWWNPKNTGQNVGHIPVELELSWAPGKVIINKIDENFWNLKATLNYWDPFHGNTEQ